MKNRNLADDIKLEKIDKQDSKKGFNYVGKHANWTSLEEQKIKVNKIENIDKKT